MRYSFVIVVLVVALCSSCQHPNQTGIEKIHVAIYGWVKKPGLYQLDSSATLATATRACGGWQVRSDDERLRSINILRSSAGQTNEFRVRIREVAPESVHLRDGDKLDYRAVLW